MWHPFWVVRVFHPKLPRPVSRFKWESTISRFQSAKSIWVGFSTISHMWKQLVCVIDYAQHLKKSWSMWSHYVVAKGLHLSIWSEPHIEAMMWHRPRPTMRHKVKVPPRATDLELFESLPLHDLWDDAKLVQVYQYLRNGISTIPNTWESAISMFDAELVSLGFQIWWSVWFHTLSSLHCEYPGGKKSFH